MSVNGARLTETWYKMGRKWYQAPEGLGHMFMTNYECKYIFEDGRSVIRKPGEDLWDDATGLIKGIDFE